MDTNRVLLDQLKPVSGQASQAIPRPEGLSYGRPTDPPLVTPLKKNFFLNL